MARSTAIGGGTIIKSIMQVLLLKAQLKSLLKKAGLSPKDVLRTKEDIYKELGLAKKDLSDDALLDLMVKYPDLIQRPIVVKGDKAILARPTDSVKTLL